MDILSGLWTNVVPFLVVLTVLVFVHEMGHYWIARRNGVKVEVFSIGFGPEIFGWNDKAGTRWKVSAVPLGGYVKMFGEYDFEDAEPAEGESRPQSPEERAVSFHHKRIGQRAAIVFAGPAANFIFAILVFALVFTLVGNPTPKAGVGPVLEDSAAAEAGFKTGDTIVAIDGKPIQWFDELREMVSVKPGQQMTFEVLREGKMLILQATPKLRTVQDEDGNDIQVGQLGVGVDPEQVGFVSVDVFTAAWMGIERTYGMTTQILGYLGEMIAGSRDTTELGGPIRIAQMSGQMAEGGMVNLIIFMAALSINLGLINLFPIPMLDGGHLLFYAAEAIRGRPLTARAQEYSFRLGLFLVLLIMVFATWNDLMRIEFIKNLVN
ncbi:MAG: RIP metalloprotease RseP [Hyphomicrobiales bacterium]|nr:RIP metalloprotease RseP [Hyphomicrobiales bacterium]